MKRISVNITDQQYAAIVALAKQLGIGFAEALRRVLDQWRRAPPPQP